MAAQPIQFRHSQPQKWDGPERRSNPLRDDPDHIVSQLQNYIDDTLGEFRKENREHFDHRIDEVISLIKDGFPGGDPRGHREVHEGYIEDAKARNAIRDAVIKQIITGTAWASLVFVAVVLWKAFKLEVLK